MNKTRKDAGLSQSEAAALLGVSLPTIRAYESGARSIPEGFEEKASRAFSAELMRRAVALGVPPLFERLRARLSAVKSELLEEFLTHEMLDDASTKQAHKALLRQLKNEVEFLENILP